MGIPKPFDAASGDVVNVDIVTPDEVKAETQKPDEKKPEPLKLEDDKPPLTPPRPTTVTQSQSSTAPSAQGGAPQQAAAQQQPAQPQPQPQQKQQQPQRSAVRPAAPPPPPTPPSPEQQEAAPSIFDPASIPKLKEIAPDPGPAVVALGGGLADSTSETARQEVTSLMAHLRKCLRLPAGVDRARELRVVMRVFLKPDGALASDPMLVSGPAATEGPALVQAATDGIKQCQPYALPPEKYQDWKMMDLTLRPRDMTGG